LERSVDLIIDLWCVVFVAAELFIYCIFIMVALWNRAVDVFCHKQPWNNVCMLTVHWSWFSVWRDDVAPWWFVFRCRWNSNHFRRDGQNGRSFIVS